MSKSEELIKKIGKKVKLLYKNGEYVRPGKESSNEINSLYGIARGENIKWDTILKEAGIENVWYRFLLKRLVNKYPISSFTEKNVREMITTTPGLKRMKTRTVLKMLKDRKSVV